MTKILFMCDAPLTIEFEKIKCLTIREFMLELGKMRPNLINDLNFEYTLVCRGVIINEFKNRHKFVKDFVTNCDQLYSTCWILAGPTYIYRFKNNLCESQITRNEKCEYCDFQNNEQYNNKTRFSYVLSCNHAFHFDCLCMIKPRNCVLCGNAINEHDKIACNY